VEGFVPFAVGYVELPDGVRVEAILESADGEDLAGAEVTLIAATPVPRFATPARLDALRSSTGIGQADKEPLR
jgi:hypothetical protein